jgi:serine/threonine protein kinase
MSLLKKGAVLGSDTTGGVYRVVSDRIAQGGFGEVYRGQLLDERRNAIRDVAIKVLLDVDSWHGETYFGHLLADQSRVVELLDSFQKAAGSGAARLVRYFLVFEWIDGGTVAEFFARDPGPLSEEAVRFEIGKVLEVLALLHRRGICHADITPGNVFVRNAALVLGDLGIAKQGLLDGPIPMSATTPEIFAPPDRHLFAWTPSDDVYQLALITLSALAGEVVISMDVCGRLLKSVDASDQFKGWIRDALSDRSARFVDAADALDALDAKPLRSARAPSSLRGQYMLFTGRMARRRVDASRLAKARGAIVQGRVHSTTTLIVTGEPNPLQIGQKAGTKLFDAHNRMRRRQRIAIIDEARFDRLLRRS